MRRPELRAFSTAQDSYFTPPAALDDGRGRKLSGIGRRPRVGDGALCRHEASGTG